MPTFSDRLFHLWNKITAFGLMAGTFFTVFLFAGVALAQDVLPPTLAEDPVKALGSTADSIAKGELWPALAGLVSLLTWGFRSGILKRLPTEGKLAFLGRAGTWLYENPIAASATPIVLSALAGLAATFASGVPFNASTFFSTVLKVGAGAIAAFVVTKKVVEAKNAGKLEAAGITTQQEALDELTKRVLKGTVPPPP